MGLRGLKALVFLGRLGGPKTPNPEPQTLASSVLAQGPGPPRLHVDRFPALKAKFRTSGDLGFEVQGLGFRV